MKFSERLFNENKEIWEKYLNHPFITEMESGKLDINSFKYYMLQDYLYLFEYTKVFAIGISKTNDTDDINILTQSISAINWELENVHYKYMKKIGITDNEIKNAKADLTNIGYTSYMIAKTYEGDVLNAFAAVLSCSWSYAYIGEIMKERTPEVLKNKNYGDWVKAYCSKEYQESNLKLINYFDKKCENIPNQDKEKLSEIFKTCSLFELRFWDMSYTKGKSDKGIF